MTLNERLNKLERQVKMLENKLRRNAVNEAVQDLRKFPNLANLLSLSEVIDDNFEVEDLDVGEPLNLSDMIIAANDDFKRMERAIARGEKEINSTDYPSFFNLLVLPEVIAEDTTVDDIDAGGVINVCTLIDDAASDFDDYAYANRIEII